jgi:hypothetical protein
VAQCIGRWLATRRVVRRREVVMFAHAPGVVVPVLLERVSEQEADAQFLAPDAVQRQLLLSFATQRCQRCRKGDSVSIGEMLTQIAPDSTGCEAISEADLRLPLRHRPAAHLVLDPPLRASVQRSDTISVGWPVVLAPFEVAEHNGSYAGRLTVQLCKTRHCIAITVVPFAADAGWGCAARVREGLEGTIVPPSDETPSTPPLVFRTRNRVTVLALTFIGSFGSYDDVTIMSTWQPTPTAALRSISIPEAKVDGAPQRLSVGLELHVFKEGFMVERGGVQIAAPSHFANPLAATRLFKLLSGVAERS